MLVLKVGSSISAPCDEPLYPHLIITNSIPSFLTAFQSIDPFHLLTSIPLAPEDVVRTPSLPNTYSTP